MIFQEVIFIKHISCPYGYTELLEDLLRLTALYNEKVCVEITGASVKGRLLPLIEIGNGQRKLLAVAAVHGREFISSAFLMRSVYEFLGKGTELCGKSLFVLPMLNPDGVEIALSRDMPLIKKENFKAELFKNNANDINLNANFPFCFKRVPKSREGGTSAASEPETKALIKLCEKEGFSAAISLHARGNCIFWRDFGNGAVKGDKELAKSFENKCGFELIAPTKNAEDYSGGFENWFRCRCRRPALCIELVKDEDIGFSDMCRDFDRAVIWDNTKELLNTFLSF